MYVILDIESTGGKYNEEGITEIAIYKHDGNKIVDEFVSLVNPERKIQSFVIGLTGINNQMLHDQPKFYEIAKRIIEITEGCIIVAHNAKFDYRMLRLEFDRLGYKFERQTLCTIKLAEKLLPNLKSYSLGKLVKKLDIPMQNRHRASGDALATVKLFELLLSKENSEDLIKLQITQNPKFIKDKKANELLDRLPQSTGIYFFYNEDDEIIYIGKSKNIKKRIQQHFANSSHKSKKIRDEINRISYEISGNELIALLIENQNIKKYKPKYNRALKKDIFSYGLYTSKNKKGYQVLNLRKIDETEDENYITSFTTLKQGRKFLAVCVEKHDLCLKLTDLHKTQGPCFNYGIKKCNGACISEESPKLYNLRVNEVIDRYQMPQENMIVYDRGRKKNEEAIILIQERKMKGYAYINTNAKNLKSDIKKNLIKINDDRDARHIFQSYIRKNEGKLKIEFLEFSL
ncbi:MAG: exonuclease domain-containing protein [Psychroflexus halocasei]